MRKLITVLLFMLVVSMHTALAQRASTYHQTFPVQESTTSAIINLSYPYVVEKWIGNNIMVETNIRMKNISRQTMDFFISQGRYEVIQKDYTGIVNLEMKPMVRKPITTRFGECEEDILLKVYVPDRLTVSATGKKVLALSLIHI